IVRPDLQLPLQLTHRVSWIFDLIADGCEEPPYSRQAYAICDQGWDKATSVSVYRIGGASLGYALRLKQPFALANFYPHYAFRFWRSEFVRRRPMTHKNEPIRRAPRFLPDPQRVIAIRANFWRVLLIVND